MSYGESFFEPSSFLSFLPSHEMWYVLLRIMNSVLEYIYIVDRKTYVLSDGICNYYVLYMRESCGCIYKHVVMSHGFLVPFISYRIWVEFKVNKYFDQNWHLLQIQFKAFSFYIAASYFLFLKLLYGFAWNVYDLLVFFFLNNKNNSSFVYLFVV